MDDREERIRRKAREIWILEGMPEGKEAEHWYKAEDSIRTEDFEAVLINPNPAAEAVEHRALENNPDPAARPADTAEPEAKPRRQKVRSTKPKGAAIPADPLLPHVSGAGRVAKEPLHGAG